MKTKAKKALYLLSPARAVALEALWQCFERGADLQYALDSALREAVRFVPEKKNGEKPGNNASENEQGQLSPRDSALATELVYSSIRLKGRLDFLVGSFLRKPQKLPPIIRSILTLAACEITCLDSIPSYASVNWAVECTKKIASSASSASSTGSGGSALARVVNGVLRNVDRLGTDASNPDWYQADGCSELVFFSRYYACPEWIVRLWYTTWGPEKTRLLLEQSIRAPAVGFRINPHAGLASSFLARLQDLKEHPDCVGATCSGLAFSRVPTLLREAEKAGVVQRQSLAGQEALLCLGARDWQHPVWDACAGRGGKTLLLETLTAGQPGCIVASDQNRRRLQGLREQVRTHSLDRVHVLQIQAHSPLPFARPFSTVLLDVPCSGLGVLSRRPDIKYKRTPQDITRLARTQTALLDQASRALNKTGTLVYLTCTLCPAENEQQIARFLENHPAFTLHTTCTTPADSPLGEFFWGAVLVRTRRGSRGES